MSKRKTIEIDAIREQANKVFRDSENEFKEGRRAIKLFVDDILMKANRYKGFRYLGASDMASGKSIGISFPEGEPKIHDDTRVEIF